MTTHDVITRVIRNERGEDYVFQSDRDDALAAQIIAELREAGYILTETLPVDIIEDALWEGFEAADNCYCDRTMDVIDTGGNYESFRMAPVAQHVLDAIEKAGFVVVARKQS